MRPVQRHVVFEVERGRLVQHVMRADGRSYTLRCTLASVQEVAWYVEAHAKDGVTTNELWDALPESPATQISVALDFLKDRGCVEVRGRRNYPASATLFEDAMTEFYALEAARDQGSGEPTR